MLVKCLKNSLLGSDAPLLDDRLTYYIDDDLVTADEFEEELYFIENNCTAVYIRYFRMNYYKFLNYEELNNMITEYGKLEESIYITEDQFEYMMSGAKLDETLAFLTGYIE